MSGTRRKSDKIFRDALLLAVNERDIDNKKKLRLVAEEMVNRAIAGDVTAIKEIRDTLDGRPTQAVTGENGGDVVIRVITDIPDRDDD